MHDRLAGLPWQFRGHARDLTVRHGDEDQLAGLGDLPRAQGGRLAESGGERGCRAGAAARHGRYSVPGGFQRHGQGGAEPAGADDADRLRACFHVPTVPQSPAADRPLHHVAAVSYAPADGHPAALSARTGESTAVAMSARLAIEGGSAVRSAPFPQPESAAPAADQRPVEAFERELAAFLDGERVVVACASHASALSLAFRVAGLEHCEAVVPALHAGAVARALLAAELRPAPAEVDPETANLAARGLARAAGDQTRGLVVTHAFGHPAAMRDLLRLAERSELTVIEDITAALGGAYAGNAAGTLGRVAALGFGAGHLLTGRRGRSGRRGDRRRRGGGGARSRVARGGDG